MSSTAPVKPVPTADQIIRAAALAFEVSVAAMFSRRQRGGLASARGVAAVLLVDLRRMSCADVAKVLHMHRTTIIQRLPRVRSTLADHIATARYALGIGLPPKPMPPSADIIRAVSIVCGVSESDMYQRANYAEVVRARRVAFVLLRDLRRLDGPAIARLMHLCHSCVYYGLKAARRDHADKIAAARELLGLAPEVTR